MPPGLTFLDLISGRAHVAEDLTLHLSGRDGPGLADKLRQAYFWIVNNAVIVPYYDVVFEEGPGRRYAFPNGDVFHLPQGPAFTSYVLLPLLTFATGRRALLVGGPGRGKTATAVLMALLAGHEKREIERAVLHGHPQLTIADMLGNPLPADLLRAEKQSDIDIQWRDWLKMRVKIVDEYNRIPTRTQSALLSLMSEGYAELLGQTIDARHGAWFLTANDDQGGGTFQVIEALKDRIDVTIRSMPFNSRFLDRLLARVETNRDPSDAVPADIVFSEEEQAALVARIRAVPLNQGALRRLEYFVGSLDFCQRASPDFEAKSKDTLKLAGIPLHQVCTEDCPLDKHAHACAQTTGGLSVRSYLTALTFAKAMAFFRGAAEVGVEDLRQILPFTLHEKLLPNRRGDFFQEPAGQALLRDKVAWIRQMWDLAMAQFDRTDRASVDPGATLLAELEAGLEGVGAPEATARMRKVEAAIGDLCKGGELSAAVYEDLVRLKYVFMRYQNYLRWLARAQDA
ncbi:MoxR family ATPase [Myxococcota bacterium]|nr:MoxR family ATPase [Myxococcota bacterium]